LSILHINESFFSDLQIVDYATRKNENVSDVEKWLNINLAYDRDEEK